MTDFYHATGGTLPNDAPSYVPRQADIDLYDALKKGKYCYVLNSRQMGKSSLMVRVVNRLRDNGVAVAAFELTSIGTQLTLDQWYNGLLTKIGRNLGLKNSELHSFWQENKDLGPLQRWMQALRSVVLTRCQQPIVIFFDEIDVVRSLPFSTDEFFAAIRECYNARTGEPNLQRLTFCLIGVATPSDLIADPRITPFNIGQRIDLSDFTAAEAAKLALGLQRDDKQATALLKRILYWTNGQPYLTQKLCQRVADDNTLTKPAGVDRLCEELFFSSRSRDAENNLQHVRTQVLDKDKDTAALLDLYRQVRSRKKIRDDDTNGLINTLRLSGLVQVWENYLWVRNRIYFRVFDKEWINANMPDAEKRRQKAAFRRGFMRAGVVTMVMIFFVGYLAFWAIEAMKEAKEAAIIVENKRYETEFSAWFAGSETLGGNTTNGILLALEALPKDMSVPKRPYVREAEVQLYNAVFNHRERLVIGRMLKNCNDLYNDGFSFKIFENICMGMTTFSPNGQRIIMASKESALWVWDANDASLLFVLHGHKNNWNASFSPDSQRIVTFSAKDNTAQVWYAKDGSLLFVLQGHENEVRNALFSPDGRHILTASKDNSTRVWDANDGSLLLILKGYNASFSPNSQRIVTASNAHVWDANNGSLLFVLKGHENKVLNASFSPDGQRIITASQDETTRVWNANDGSLLLILQVHEDKEILRATFSPDSQRIVMGLKDKTQILDANDGSPLFVLEGCNASFSPDNQYIVTELCPFASQGFPLIRLNSKSWGWDANDGSLLFVLPGHEPSFSPNGQRIVTHLWRDGTARIWDANNSSGTIVLRGHEASVETASFSPDGQRIVTASKDNTARVWDANDGSLRFVLEMHEKKFENLNNAIFSNNATFSPDGQRIVTILGDNTAQVWDANNGSLLFVLQEHENNKVRNASFSPNGQRIVTVSETISEHTPRWYTKIWDANDASLLFALQGYNYNATFSSDSQRILTTSYDEIAPPNDNTRVWDAKNGSQLFVLKGNNATFSPDGQRIVTVLGDNTIQVWNANDGSLLTLLDGNNAIFSPNGQRIVTLLSGVHIAQVWDANDGSLLALLDGQSRIWYPKLVRALSIWDRSWDGKNYTIPMRHNEELLSLPIGHVDIVFQGHEGIVSNATFSPDSQRIVTASEDKTAKIWDTNGSLLATLKGHKGEVNNASFSPDGQHVVTASKDKTARVWRVFPTTQALIDYANKVVPRCLTPNQRAGFHLPSDPSYDLIEEGEQLAKQRHIKAATAKFKEAKAIAPCHKFLNYPEDKAREIAAMSLIEKGNKLADKGKTEAAIEQFKQAQKVDGRFKFGDIEDYAKSFEQDLTD